MRLNNKRIIILLLVLLAVCGLILYKPSRSAGNSLLHQYNPVWAVDERLNIVFLFAIKSYPENPQMRKAVRDTWGTYIDSGSNSKVLFYMGKSLRPEINSQVAEESKRYHDIIQGNFIDSFRNQSLCTLNILMYISKTFKTVKYLFKANDSTFINIPYLIRLLKTHKNQLHHFIMGDVTNGTQPERNNKSSWYTSKDAYSLDHYPTYVQGYAYLLSGHLIPGLVKESTTAPFLWIEDVFVTGVLAMNLNVNFISNGKFGKPGDKCQNRNYIAIPYLQTVDEMKSVYISIEIPSESCHNEIIL